MADNSTHWFSKIFGDFANVVARAAGRASAFVLAVAVIIVWAATGPVFKFSDIWQLIINTGTTIVTFLMVFLIQNSQNRDSAAIQVKLDELIRVGAVHNRFVGIEHLTEEEIERIAPQMPSAGSTKRRKRNGPSDQSACASRRRRGRPLTPSGDHASRRASGSI